MLLTADIGNTNITIGLHDGENLLFTARLTTKVDRTRDEFAAELKSIMELNCVNYKDVEDAVICSVVPTVSRELGKAILKLCNVVPLEIGPGIKTGLNIKIDNPAQLGADLVAGAVGAIESYTMPCIIIDLGTATTVSVLDKEGSFIGCTISAGVKLTLRSLATNTSQLPLVSIEAPKSVIGKNTADSMKAGLVFGTAAMIDGLIDRIEDELGEEATVVATGGLAKEIVCNCRKDVIYNENLLLDGLRAIYNKNIR